MYMGESEKFIEFSLKVVRTLGTKVEEATVIEKLLRSIPDKFLPIVSTIEQWGDVLTMSVAEVVRRLRTFEESTKGRWCDKEEKLVVVHAEPQLTCAEWEAIVAKEKRNGEASDSGVNKNGDRKKYHDRFDKSKINCRYCGEYGHFADECPEPRKVTKAMAQLAVAETDDEPTLL
ncbi:hypothetical protein BAE44_0023058 [Dichanthelium oligosanthes]|uniref:CCHC-type domain-containing protein n=1 Tax=Dichanthelium oligosanthes TaxID=888268 RepID=A0A1E5UST3_9POAL|nr:hypothetical protein BAE44_0023058 [Dichanthelium oligosanthes]